VAYTTINGQIVSEKRNGVPSDYIPDALGSTIALLSDTHQITDKWTYWPNGQVRTRTGTNPTPFTFVGTRGYHSDIVNNSVYVRKRILRPGLARWHTLDPLWPLEAAYAYVVGSPVTLVDPSGLNATFGGGCDLLPNCMDKYKCCLAGVGTLPIYVGTACGAAAAAALGACAGACLNPATGVTCWYCLLPFGALAGCVIGAILAYEQNRSNCVAALKECQHPSPPPPPPPPWRSHRVPHVPPIDYGPALPGQNIKRPCGGSNVYS